MAERGDHEQVSAVVLTQDVEDLIRECLASAVWADEIVVMDGGSRDRTLAICREFTNRIFERPWPGVSTLQWRAAIEQAGGPWILLLPSDGRIQPEGQREIREAIRSGTCAGYRLPLKNHFLGRWMQHCGWWPDYHVLLFRKDRASMETREHGEVTVDGPVGTLRVPMVHFAHRSVAEYVRKTNRYTDAEQRDWRSSDRPLQGRFVVTKAVRNFQKAYWKQHGYRDEIHGLVFCGLMAFYKSLLYAKYWERQRHERDPAWPIGKLSRDVDELNDRTARKAAVLMEAQGVVPLSTMRRQLEWGSLGAFAGRCLLGHGLWRGTSGLVDAMLGAWEHFLVWAKYWESAYARS